MNMNITTLWEDRNALYKLSDTLREQLEAAEDADEAAWAWYESLSEEAYFAIADEADDKVKNTSEACRRLRERVESVEASIKLIEKLEDEVQFLEQEGVL